MESQTERNDNTLISLPENVVDKIAMHLPSAEDVYNFSKVSSEFAFVTQPPTAHNWLLKHYHWDQEDMTLYPEDPEVLSSTQSLLEWRLKAQRNLMTDNPYDCWSSEDYGGLEGAGVESSVRHVVINRQHRVVASLDDRGLVGVWNLQGQRLRQQEGCYVHDVYRSMDTAGDALVWYDEHRRMHLQDLHTGRDVWVDTLAWAPAPDAAFNNSDPPPPPATLPGNTHLFSPNLVLATKQYEHVLLFDSRMSPNTNPAIHYRVPDTYSPYLMGAYAVHEGTRTMQAPGIHNVHSIVLGCIDDPQMRLLDLRMMTGRSTGAMTRQEACVFAVELHPYTACMDASGHTVVFGGIREGYTLWEVGNEDGGCDRCPTVYQLEVWDAHEQKLLAEEKVWDNHDVLLLNESCPPRLSDDARNVLLASGSAELERCLVWRMPLMGEDWDWESPPIGNGGGAVEHVCPTYNELDTDGVTCSVDMVDTLLVTGCDDGSLVFYDFGGCLFPL